MQLIAAPKPKFIPAELCETREPPSDRQATLLRNRARLPAATAIGSHNRANPMKIQFGDLICFIDHIRDTKIKPGPFYIWRIENVEDAALTVQDLRSQSTKGKLGGLNVERQLTTLDYSDPLQNAYAASLEPGTAGAIAISHRSSSIDPENSDITYWVELDMIYSATTQRKKCLGAAALWPIVLQTNNDIESFARRSNRLKHPPHVTTIIAADIESKRGERAVQALYSWACVATDINRDTYPKFDGACSPEWG